MCPPVAQGVEVCQQSRLTNNYNDHYRDDDDDDDEMMMMMMMMTGVWEDNDPSLSVRCAEGRPRVEVTQVGEIFSKWVKVWPFG